jgi:hypothetical protein
VAVFPPAPPVTVAVDGRNLSVYVRAHIVRDRVIAPLSLVRMLVDRMWLEDGDLIVERGGRRARVPLRLRFDGGVDVTSVELAPLLRRLGDELDYSASRRTLEVRTAPRAPLGSASPFTGLQPPVRAVFTPEPVPTPRPVWSGSPLPRRTPLPPPPEAYWDYPARMSADCTPNLSVRRAAAMHHAQQCPSRR